MMIVCIGKDEKHVKKRTDKGEREREREREREKSSRFGR